MADRRKYLIPLLVLAISVFGAIIIVASRPDVKPAPPDSAPKIIRATTVRKENVRMTVHSQGTVTPRTESALVSQVSGIITSVSPSFAAGGFFDEGDILVTLDPRDYRFALTRAEDQVAQAELALQIEEEQGEVAREEWGELNDGDIPELVAREPQLRRARTALEAARSGVLQAKLNLERTRLKAPFKGRVRLKNVDVGQFVTPGMPVATIYAVDYAEVRLPIPDSDLAFLDTPHDLAGEESDRERTRVTLRSTFAGEEYEWEGYLARVEGEVDPRSRMIHAVARVDNPYAVGLDSERPPLTVGMFVDAEIEGRTVDGLFIVPRSALRDNDQVLVVDAEERLRFRSVEPFRFDSGKVYLKSGLKDGERVCISPLPAVVDGMSVRVFKETEHSDEGAGTGAEG